jgi:hypothetical protein
VHAFFSEFFDPNDPPLFKHLLLIEAKPNRLTIACRAATGCVDDVSRKPEDVLVCESDAAGEWRWQVAAGERL